MEGMKKKTRPIFDNHVLRGHIVRACGSIKEFSIRFGISETAMQYKVANKSGWSREDICLACQILGINDPYEIWRTFFSIDSWENVK